MLYLMVMIGCISFKSRNKTRMSTLATPIQHCTAGSSQENSARKINERPPKWKGNYKTIFIHR